MRRARRRFLLLLAIVAGWSAAALWQTYKPLPPGTHIAGPWYSLTANQASFIADITAADAYGRHVSSQAISDQVLDIVRGAREFIVLDQILLNKELRDALIERRAALAQLKVLLICDPLAARAGEASSVDFALLRAAGFDIALTDLSRLRNSNFIFPSRRFKANHRKVIIGDDGLGGLIGLITSAETQEGGDAHSNVAAKLSGPALAPLLASELAIARFSGWTGRIVFPAAALPEAGSERLDAHNVRARVLTEGAIRRELLARIETAVRGDSIDIAMLYISHRAVVEALLAASARGVSVRLILDPNKDAADERQTGIPNQPVASELVAASDGAIRVRWYRTHGERFHAALVMVYGAQNLWFTTGSAYLTRADLDDYDLEANTAIEVTRDSALAVQMMEYFDTLWNNRAAMGIEYTADFDVYADPAQSLYWLYRLMEATGLSRF